MNHSSADAAQLEQSFATFARPVKQYQKRGRNLKYLTCNSPKREYKIP
jgi:hypothetical protein